MKKPQILARLNLSNYSPRDVLAIGLPAVLLMAAALYLTAQFVRPAPPDKLTLGTGSPGGAYESYALRYKEVLARYGIELILKPSAGAVENLSRLQVGEIEAGFVQSGLSRANEDSPLRTLGSLYPEPMWIFYRSGAFKQIPERLTELKGRRIAIGAPGSGSRQLALTMLEASALVHTTKLIEVGGSAAASQLIQGRIDAVMLVGTVHSSAVWQLLYTPGIRVMSLRAAEAYTRHFPYLSHLVLPEGAIDLVTHLPAQEAHLVAPMASLAIHEDVHPALVDVLLWAASEVHGSSGIFQRAGEFPKPETAGLPLAAEAERYYQHGKPFLQRYLPFWAATLIDRMVVMLIPLLAVLVPLLKFAPALYGWRIRSRIDKRYGELKLLEAEFLLAPEAASHGEWLARLDELAKTVNQLPAPLPYTSQLYTLRSHIELVRHYMEASSTAVVA